MTPAFSPGPQITRGPVVGKVCSHTFEDLYEQCSLHIAAKMPVSVRFGARPRIATARSNSSWLSPCSAASSGVTLLPITTNALAATIARAHSVLRDAPPRGAPQDEEYLCVASRAHLILRKPRSGC